MFKIGDKIECISTSPSKRVKKGEIYTVRRTYYTVGVYLKEINSAASSGAFGINFFKLVPSSDNLDYEIY